MPPQNDRRAVSDAAHLTIETDESLRTMVAAAVGDVSETTRALAGLELAARLVDRELLPQRRTVASGCGCECCRGGFCGGCGHAGCSGGRF